MKCIYIEDETERSHSVSCQLTVALLTMLAFVFLAAIAAFTNAYPYYMDRYKKEILSGIEPATMVCRYFIFTSSYP